MGDKLNGWQRWKILVSLKAPIHEAALRLQSFPWDSETELATLTRMDGQRVLTQLVEGAITADACSKWATPLKDETIWGWNPAASSS